MKRDRALQMELELGGVGFQGKGKTGVPGEKPLRVRERTNHKLNPHMASKPEFEPGPCWWEGSALTTAPPLLPLGEESSRMKLCSVVPGRPSSPASHKT